MKHIICFYRNRLYEPTNVAEVLTVRQILALREHTVGYLEATGIFQFMLHLESIEVAFLLHNIERLYRVDVLFAVLSDVGSYQFQTDGIVQTLFVDNESNDVFLTAFDRTGSDFFALVVRYNFNAVPLGSNFFLPCGNFLRLGIVTGV